LRAEKQLDLDRGHFNAPIAPQTEWTISIVVRAKVLIFGHRLAAGREIFAIELILRQICFRRNRK
jgi:hypothetical protein